MHRLESRHQSVVLVAGPTASGKSALAAMLATELDGMVINADAMQVYRGLPVLTAQPAATLRAGVPHALYETVDPAQNFSAGQWQAAALATLDEARRQQLLPIVTGGTGMYFQTLLQGIAAIPPVPPALRAALREDYQRLGETACRARLAEHDLAAAQKIQPGDQLRLLRALEIVLATGRTQRDWQSQTSGGIMAKHRIIPILLLPPRAELYAACDRRFAAMAAQGAVEEVKTLLARQLSPALPAMKIIGVSDIAAFLTGQSGWDAALASAQQATRNYAKRQLTWFRNQWVNNKIGFNNPLLAQDDFYQLEQAPMWRAKIAAAVARS